MRKKIIIIVVLVALIFVALFWSQNVTKTEAPIIQTEEEVLQTLDIKHQYKDGVHTFIGSLELPNPCYTYNTVVEDTNNPSEKIIRVLLEEKTEETCIQVITTANFEVSYPGDENLTFRGFVNDQEYKLNIFDIPADVDIRNFEIYMKG